ncbi:hypothetical protein DFQ28_004967 [Apophysomyces sp. BC1034]|nr:hypothetical protein DFQ30_002968 [Apophysomyces sp. BC1015]KAG0180126.1 hypothetical protein DFQ29_001188 [Apophysomyces sp. BC1021]KAG0188341.1 hypothetical protein DFQ28_004967 [Apophysomyces sp. BC1034]
MASLVRSSTARLPVRQKDNHGQQQKHRGLRGRASSFTQMIRRQKSDSYFNPPIGYIGRPGRELKTPTPTPNISTATSSFLTVDDVHTGGTSSIDTGSEDDECEILPTAEDHEEHEEHDEYAEVDVSDTRHRSIAVTFKNKLNLSRKSAGPFTSKRAVSVFAKLGRSQDKKEKQPQPHNESIHLAYPQHQSLLDNVERDQYGFTKGSQWLSLEDYDNFERFYKPIMNRRLQKWRHMMANNNGQWPHRSSKFKRYIRKGIPHELRGQAWLYYSGGEAKMQANPGVYDEYVTKAETMGRENEYLDIIERDLHRTFPDNIQFKTTKNTAAGDHGIQKDVPAINALRRLLSAFSLYSPTIGYCQSLNYVAGLLLLFMKEEEAFWTFVALIHDILPPNIYDVTMEGANIDQNVLMLLLSERCPQIWNRISGGKSFWECEEMEGAGMPTTSLVTSHWFLTLFINILPIESVLRVWDCLFYEGQRTLFRVAIAIFKMNEHEILAVEDSLEVFQVVQNTPKKMVDCHRLMDTTYHKLGSTTRVSEQELEKRRKMFKIRREERRRNAPVHSKLKRGGVAGTIIHKAMEARRFVERAKTVRR